LILCKIAMPEKKVIIRYPAGLHARPASLFAQLAARYKSEVTIRKDDLIINGKSIMNILLLAAEQGSEITIQTQGEDADSALAALVNLVEKSFAVEAPRA